MTKRNYTVGRKPGYTDNITPELRIGGKWLSKAGINVGDHVELSVDNNLIIISAVELPKEEMQDDEGKQNHKSLEEILHEKRARPQWVRNIYEKLYES